MRPHWTQILIVLLVVVLLFGANRLPGLARSVGQSMKIFKNEVKDLADEDRPDAAATKTTVTGPAVPGPTAPAPDPVVDASAQRLADTPPDPAAPPRG
ncbi:twin-arginine translocase TatA/TatE family subunit [Cellulomonas shaoxiangyii]|uniref:Sec-independent protein translocase protein TatA n=1 Tax=Cellulomonas shaoxiangyii TaxID=2566013 RepID=A0A4P7SJD8_9CELL|nr:twin-arginine translocase TatA/TatE family subunit [Cellulomonas shaoxiangyii]QCB93607.1 twin-arginine translocase TatA/TatE family subunit [Cellulomonas shaoxiangyii]TGY85689.1 twin-arginine translocase TatA/TatE family subunit [Cellulomonas shaoxiangyii]